MLHDRPSGHISHNGCDRQLYFRRQEVTVLGGLSFVLALTMGAGASLPLFFDLPSFMIVFTGVLATLLLSGASVPEMVLAPFRWDSYNPKAAGAWRTAGVASLVWGTIGTLLGVIIMLDNVGKINSSLISKGMAIGLLTQLYGILGFVIAYAARRRMEDV